MPLGRGYLQEAHPGSQTSSFPCCYSGSVDYRLCLVTRRPFSSLRPELDSRRAIKKPVQLYPAIHKCEWEQPQGTALFVFRSSCSIPKVAQERVNTLSSGDDAERGKAQKQMSDAGCRLFPGRLCATCFGNRSVGFEPSLLLSPSGHERQLPVGPPSMAKYCQGLLRTHHQPFCILRLFHYPIYRPLNHTEKSSKMLWL